MSPALSSLLIFILAYTLFIVFQHRRSWVACGGAVAVVATGALSWHSALTEAISWNVIALFVGTLVLAELFMHSRMPACMAEWLIDRTHTARGAMIAVCLLAGFISAFVENVAVVLLVAPVALSLAEKLKISPVRLLIFIALSSNLQGTATLIGDPPSMILAGYMKLSFMDFFWYQGKPGICAAVELGALGTVFVMGWFLRHHRQKVELLEQESVKSWVPTVLLSVLIIGLALSTLWDPDFKWFAGTFTCVLAVLGLAWYHLLARWGRAGHLVKSMDWDTALFLVGVFVIVGAVSSSGWLDRLASWIAGIVGGNIGVAFVAIVTLSVLVSAVVDNVPFLLVMIPVVQRVADSLNTPVPLLMFGLLIGACLGGNITPIGASANVVAIGILRKQGHTVSFREFMLLGIPFTLVAVLFACVLVWLVWAP